MRHPAYYGVPYAAECNIGQSIGVVPQPVLISMSIFLEVIVTSVAEAIAAQRGGADRLELVRNLDQGGLTPPLALVAEVTAAVTIPVRVMVRETDSMSIAGPSEMARLQDSIRQFSTYPVDGLVLGFLCNGQIDTQSLQELMPERGHVTFHRAFDEAADPVSAIAAVKRYQQIDRILTRAGAGSWSTRIKQLEHWQSMAGPALRMLFAIGRDTSNLDQLARSPNRYEVHVGRAARIAHVNSGAVSAELVAALKRTPCVTP